MADAERAVAPTQAAAVVGSSRPLGRMNQTELDRLVHEVCGKVRPLAKLRHVPPVRMIQRRHLGGIARRLMATRMARRPRRFATLHVLLAALDRKFFALAFYSAHDRTIYLVGRWYRHCTADRLKTTLAHELTHAMQHQRHAAFFEGRIHDYEDAMADRNLDLMHGSWARMCLLEGEAKMVEREAWLKHFRGPLALAYKGEGWSPCQDALSVASTLGELLLDPRSAGAAAVAAQYADMHSRGEALLAQLMHHNPQLKQELFVHPALAEVLYRTQGTAKLTLPLDTSDHTLTHYEAIVAQLKRMNPFGARLSTRVERAV